LILMNVSDRNGIPIQTHQLFRVQPEETYLTFLSALWMRGCAAAFGDSLASTGHAALLDLLRPWAERPIPALCKRPSFVSADGFPAELSFSWRGGQPEVRTLFEPATAADSAYHAQQQGRALVRGLTGRPGVAIDRYLTVENLFTAADPHPHRSGVWLSLAVQPATDPKYKVYLNPWIGGDAWAVVEDMMRRLGLAVPWQMVSGRRAELVAAGADLDYVALDLDADPLARVKVYFRHRSGGVDGINQVAGLASLHDPHRAAAAMRLVYGASADDLGNEPMTGLAFRSGDRLPGEANLYLRLPGSVGTDQAAADRIVTVMEGEQVGADAFRRVLAALAPRDPHQTSGLVELLSFRTRGSAATDIGVYFRLPVHVPVPDENSHVRAGHGFPPVPAAVTASRS
jgi:DMATS type aromatic prenyltransferase